MNLYYESFIQDLENKLNEGKFQDALYAINQELNMPYIPLDVEEVLKNLKKEAKAHIQSVPASLSEDKLEKLAKGNLLQQESAVALLPRFNLRNQKPVIEVLLNSKLDAITKGEVIRALMEQRLDDEFSFEKNGLDVHFIPSLIPQAKEEAVVQKTIENLDDWFMNEDIMLYNFSIHLLEQEILARLPFDFEQEDDKALALALACEVYKALGREDEIESFKDRIGMKSTQEAELFIKK